VQLVLHPVLSMEKLASLCARWERGIACLCVSVPAVSDAFALGFSGERGHAAGTYQVKWQGVLTCLRCVAVTVAVVQGNTRTGWPVQMGEVQGQVLVADLNADGNMEIFVGEWTHTVSARLACTPALTHTAVSC
jgi:hypothetical protein